MLPVTTPCAVLRRIARRTRWTFTLHALQLAANGISAWQQLPNAIANRVSHSTLLSERAIFPWSDAESVALLDMYVDDIGGMSASLWL